MILSRGTFVVGCRRTQKKTQVNKADSNYSCVIREAIGVDVDCLAVDAVVVAGAMRQQARARTSMDIRARRCAWISSLYWQLPRVPVSLSSHIHTHSHNMEIVFVVVVVR